MSFTAGELNNIANAAFDYIKRSDALSQSIQMKPLYNAMRKGQKSFPGAKEYVGVNVKGDYTSTISGYNTNDTVTYSNPANIEQAKYKWYEIHSGIEVTHTELKVSGISVVDDSEGKTSEHSKREIYLITDLLRDKLEDLSEGWARSFDEMLHLDGTQDAKEIPGIAALFSETPTVGVVGGIDRASNAWWRNRVNLAIDASTATNLNTINAIRTEMRQLSRYGGNPSLAIAGSDFLEALEEEFQSKGYYTDMGFYSKGKNDFGMSDLYYKGMNFIYDPALDDDSKSKYCYLIDEKRTYLKTMEGEDMKTHSPSRPADQYVIYRAMTYTGALCEEQMNANGILSIA